MAVGVLIAGKEITLVAHAKCFSITCFTDRFCVISDSNIDHPVRTRSESMWTMFAALVIKLDDCFDPFELSISIRIAQVI